MRKKILIGIILGSIILCDSNEFIKKANAKEDVTIDMDDTSEEQEQEDAIPSVNEVIEETTTADVTTEEVNQVTTEGVETSTEKEDIKSQDDKTAQDKKDKEVIIDKAEIINDGIFDIKQESNTIKGQRYYCNSYLYQSQEEYLLVYQDYLKKLIEVGESMFEYGEITENDLQSYKAEKDMVDAQIQIANNNMELNNMFLIDNNLSYDNYYVSEEKNIKSIDEYLELNDKLDKMTVAQYITDYKNASAMITAKNSELEYKKMEQQTALVLLEEGEITELELKKYEVDVAKVNYELQQYYVQRCIAFINICGEIEKNES